MYTSADSIPKEVTRLMAQLFHRNMPAWWRKYCFLFLAFCWIAGLLSGASACLAAGDSLNSLMRGAAARPVSIVSLLGVTMFPFLLSAFAVYISEPWLLLIVSFGDAFVLPLFLSAWCSAAAPPDGLSGGFSFSVPALLRRLCTCTGCGT